MPVLGESIGGRYRLEAVIGRGGMSTVYRAFDTVLERPVAIKLLHPGVAADGDQLERFRREARLVARLSHPNVVTVIDAGEQPAGTEGGDSDPATACPYIVFEYVEGETLKELIRREGPLDITQAVAYALELARALGAAHAQDLVHRDVKPQNVLIGEEGAAKITDFGIARPLTEAALTMPGRVLATTDYIAPEQALGEPVSPRSDLYSLGIVLFEMLTGDVPFHGESAVAVAMKHVREQLPDVQRLRPGISAATAAVLERATAKDPANRYPDAEAMAADLERALALEASRSGQATGEVTSVLRTLPGEARERVPWRVRHPMWLTLALAAVVLVLVAGALLAAFGLTHRGAGQPARRHRGAACRRSPWPRTQPTTTTRSAPGPKTATRSATSSTTTPTRRGAPSSTTRAPSRSPAWGSTSTPPRGSRPGPWRCRHPRPASRCRFTLPTTSTSTTPSAARYR